MKVTGDDSLFAWEDANPERGRYRGLLARSPEEFERCQGISPGQQREMSLTNVGLRLQVNLLQHPSRQECYFATLGAHRRGGRVAIPLRKVYTEEVPTINGKFGTRVQYARIDTHFDDLVDVLSSDRGPEIFIYVRNILYIPKSFAPFDTNSFHLQKGPGAFLYGDVTLLQVWPSKYWDPTSWHLRIPGDGSRFLSVILFAYVPDWGGPLKRRHFCLILGFFRDRTNISGRRPWVAIEEGKEHMEQPEIEEICDRYLNTDWECFGTETVFKIDDFWDETWYKPCVNISVESALLNERISFLVKIDGLSLLPERHSLDTRIALCPPER